MRVITKSRLPDIDYTFNPYVGCAHGCIYCYARCFTRDKEASENWGKVVKVKDGIMEALLKDVKSVRKGSVIGISTITDPYQPLERKLRIIPRAAKIMLDAGLHISIQTKSDLVTRDLDLFAGRSVDIGFTITTVDERISRLIEPNAPLPDKRVQALRKVAEYGIQRWIFYGPIIPRINDDEGTAIKIADLAIETGSEVILDYLRLRPRIIKSIKSALGAEVVRAAMERDKMAKRLQEIKELMERKGVKVSYAFPQIELTKFLG